MIDEATLDRAVNAGVLNVTQRNALLALAREDQAALVAEEPIDLSVDEQMRLVGGGNDIFVTVGIVLLFSGALFALQAVVSPTSMLLAAILDLETGFYWFNQCLLVPLFAGIHSTTSH